MQTHLIPHDFRPFMPALALLLFSTLAIGWLNYRPSPTAPVLVWFSPHWNSEETFVAATHAGGRVIAKGPFPFSIILQSDAPDFFDRLHQAGAWLLLDARNRAGCFSLLNLQ